MLITWHNFYWQEPTYCTSSLIVFHYVLIFKHTIQNDIVFKFRSERFVASTLNLGLIPVVRIEFKVVKFVLE